MYKVGRMWQGKYIFYCGHAPFSMWTENANNANYMPLAIAKRIAAAYSADIIKCF